MNIAAIQIGPFTLSLYGMLIAFGIVAAIGVSYLEAKRRGEDTKHILNIALIIVPLGVIGARLYHVIDRWDYFMQHPGEIIGGQGLGIFGAVIGGAIGLIIYTRWQKLGTLRWLDIVAPAVLLAQAIGRWGNYFNQELYGYPTDLPWGIYIAPENRLPGFENFSHFQPLFFYEFLWNLIGFAVLMVLGRKLRNWLKDGDIFLFYVIIYGIGRFYLEGLKINVWTLAGIPTARWIAGAGILISAAIILIRHLKEPRTKYHENQE